MFPKPSRVRSDTFGVTLDFPPKWIKNVRSLTFRTAYPAGSPRAAVIGSACSASVASQVTFHHQTVVVELPHVQRGQRPTRMGDCRGQTTLGTG